MLSRIPFVLAAGLVASLPSAALAEDVTYAISPSQSTLSITSGTVTLFGFATFPVQPLDKNGFTAAVAGAIHADRTDDSITFGSLSTVVPVEHGSYLPGRIDTPETPAPGSYALLFPTKPVVDNFWSITRDLVFAFPSDIAHPIADGAFLPTGTTWQVTAGVGDLSRGNPPQSDLTTTPPFLNTSVTPGAIADDGTTETLTMPVAFQMQILAEFVVITLNYEGVLVAERSTGEPTCEVDWDDNGVVNSTDVSAFINSWFEDQAKGTSVTDFNNDGVSNSTDVSDFINVWFVSQPYCF